MAERRVPERARDWCQYAVAGRDLGIELLRAHFMGHAYERHSHDAYAIGVTEAGAQAFNCCGAHHVSTEHMVIALNPGEPHDGHAGDARGFTYRMLYIRPELARRVIEDWRDGRPSALPFARTPVIDDPALAHLVLALHRALGEGAPRLECEALLDDMLVRFARGHSSLRNLPYGDAARPGDAALRRVRDYLEDTDLAEDLAADDLARLAGISRFHLCRRFRKAYGLPPHAYRLQRRLAAAKELLARGTRAADVAAALGFADQSHLHKRFKGAFGITPGQFAAAASPLTLPSSPQGGEGCAGLARRSRARPA
ncbi:MAG TPA: AraC family transcriptional regulator [Alphaproteobacteria bacterium]|nr:AraC family transcriptional regulator [Alphaproteobacteria bacterium]